MSLGQALPLSKVLFFLEFADSLEIIISNACRIGSKIGYEGRQTRDGIAISLKKIRGQNGRPLKRKRRGIRLMGKDALPRLSGVVTKLIEVGFNRDVLMVQDGFGIETIDVYPNL